MGKIGQEIRKKPGGKMKKVFALLSALLLTGAATANDTVTEFLDREIYADSADVSLQNEYLPKFANAILKIVENTQPDEIKNFYLTYIKDDQTHLLMTKNDTPFMYMTRHLGVLPSSPLFESLDIIRDSTYSITIYSNPIVSFRGDYNTLKDFVSLMSGGYERTLDEETPGIERAYQRAPLSRRGYALALESLKDL